jgi:hypothetical protein
MPAQLDPSSSAMGWRAALLALAIILGLTNLVELASTFRPGYWDSVGQIGINGGADHGKIRVSTRRSGQSGVLRFTHHDVDSSAAEYDSSISPGDLVSVAPEAGRQTTSNIAPSVLEFFRYRPRSEPIQLRAEHTGQSRIIAATHPTPVSVAGLIRFYGQVFVDLIFALVGGLLAWRRPGDKAIRALAIAMICWASNIPAATEHPTFDLLWMINQLTARVWVDILLAYWAIHLSPESRWGISRELRRAWPAWATLTIVLGVLLRTAMYRPFPLGVDTLQTWSDVNQTLLYLAPLAALIEGVFSTQGETRTRIRWGLLIFGFHFFLYPYRIYLVPRLDVLWPDAIIQDMADNLLQLVLPVGLLYATLRHRLLDLSFALNRGLVYGGISAIVLLVFFGLERVSESVLKLEGREQNAMLAGGIAFAIFLFFHKMRDWVERGVERLFFSSWHHKEASLREYVRSAAHVTRIDSLLTSCIGAVDRFTEHAGCAIYRRDSDGNYQRLRSSIADAPPTIDGNEQAILAMRVDRGPVTCADVGSSLPYECVLPIIYRGEVDGFLLLNDKADKEAYRPDQIELIAFAVQQIGLDLTALEREQYKQQASEFQVAASTARSSAEDMRSLLQLALTRQAPSGSGDL